MYRVARHVPLPPSSAWPGYRFSGNGQVVGHLGNRHRVQFFGPDCHPTDGWDLPEGEFIETFDVSAERSLIALTQNRVVRSALAQVSTAIIDTATRQKVLELPTWRPSNGLDQCGFYGNQASVCRFGRRFLLDAWGLVASYRRMLNGRIRSSAWHHAGMERSGYPHRTESVEDGHLRLLKEARLDRFLLVPWCPTQASGLGFSLRTTTRSMEAQDPKK